MSVRLDLSNRDVALLLAALDREVDARSDEDSYSYLLGHSMAAWQARWREAQELRDRIAAAPMSGTNRTDALVAGLQRLAV